MSNDDIKQAFQDGLRTAIKVAREGAQLALDENNLRAHQALTDQLKALRMLIDHDLGVPPIPYEARLACACDVVEAIVDHAREGGSFRVLIYQRMGFDLDAYVPLHNAGGLTISNEFTLTEADDGDQELAARLLKVCWPKKGETQIEIVGGKEPWRTITESAFRIQDLSRALAAEQEKRRRVEAEAKEKPWVPAS